MGEPIIPVLLPESLHLAAVLAGIIKSDDPRWAVTPMLVVEDICADNPNPL